MLSYGNAKKRLEQRFRMSITDILNLPLKCQTCSISNLCNSFDETCKLDKDYKMLSIVDRYNVMTKQQEKGQNNVKKCN